MIFILGFVKLEPMELCFLKRGTSGYNLSSSFIYQPVSFLSQVIEDPIQVERVKFVFETENGLLGKYALMGSVSSEGAGSQSPP